MDRFKRPRQGALAAVLILALPLCAGGAEAVKPQQILPATFSPTARGAFPNPRPLIAAYHFGWAGISAAQGSMALTYPSKDELQFEGMVTTNGMVRMLWKLDAKLKSRLQAATLQPIETRQEEVYSKETDTTTVRFAPDQVTRERIEKPSSKPSKPKRTRLPQAFDLFGAVMLVRSQALKAGDRYELVVFPSSSAYLARVKVAGRETVTVEGGRYPAIKLELQLLAIDKKKRLAPHQKFKSATAWMSDDENRLLLRVEAEVYVGSVWVELQRPPTFAR